NVFAENIFQATFQQAYTKITNATIQTYNPVNKSFIVSHTTIKAVDYRPGTNTLGIVVFCLIFGSILGTMGSKAKVVVDFFNVIYEVIMKLIRAFIWLTPFGVLSIVAGKFLMIQDMSGTLTQLGVYVVTVFFGIVLYQLFIMQLLYFIFVRKNPYKFYAALAEATITAFAVASSAACLPISFNILDNKLNVDQRISRFVLPLGVNINTNASAMYLSLSTMFIAQRNGLQMGIGKCITLSFTCTIASFSNASVPSSSLIVLQMVLISMDAPVQDMALLFTIDWLLDRMRTTTNMLDDCYTSAVVEKLSEKELKAWDLALQQKSRETDVQDANPPAQSEKCENYKEMV
ncbi:hypothetical protein JTB14_025062, partial [Gonioctena quinquepunctata]